jgi:hypothetical protein
LSDVFIQSAAMPISFEAHLERKKVIAFSLSLLPVCCDALERDQVIALSSPLRERVGWFKIWVR